MDRKMVPLLYFLFVIALLSVKATAIDGTASQNLLVDQICNYTSNYSFCVNSFYSDPRTPDADQDDLAYVGVGSAYDYAVATLDFVSQLLSNSPSSDHNLWQCVTDYNDAVSYLATAYNDLDYENFFELGSLSGKASDSADHCLKGFQSSPSLTVRTTEFKSWCEIVGAVGKSFTGGNY